MTISGLLKFIIRVKYLLVKFRYRLNAVQKLSDPSTSPTELHRVLIFQDFGDEVNGISRNWKQLIQSKFKDDVSLLWVSIAN